MAALRIFIAVIWIAFWLYWFVAAMRATGTIYGGGKAAYSMRIVIIAVVVLLIRVYHIRSGFWSRVFSNHEPVTSSLVVMIAGAVIVITGLLFAVWARVNLSKNWAMPMTHKESTTLITSGPYRYVRHPIYTGIIVGSLGTAVVSGVIWLVPSSIFVGYFTFSAVREEKYLVGEFGERYVQYKQHSKMLIPFVF